ncbi:MAG: hypothetical protein HN353_04715 [Bdellovibrionales bacterium]|nr:hypothetical protein [Bdellovibrionales bacterium]MBT3527412.1 hypothetical protein [Bdellovibrionales bacterium]MBT7669677.1 hypothetical protein [Bdellovibrionales bacterium]
MRYSSRDDYLKRHKSPKSESKPATAAKTTASNNPISQTVALNKTVAKGVTRVVAETLDQAKQVVVAAASKDSLKNATKMASQVAGRAIASTASATASPPATTDKMQKAGGPFFISGFSFKSLSGDDSAMKRMGEKFDNSQQFSWHQEDEILSKILLIPNEEPLIIVGHSFGGDAAVSLANRLNSIEGGFRKIDLLVTLDSVGFDNDIIPPNVQKNMNFITDRDLWFNDGPNMARDFEKSDVVNYLRPEEHIDIDDAVEVQSSIFHTIKEILSKDSAVSDSVEIPSGII